MQSYAERLIDRFGLLWGRQKVLAAFGSSKSEIDDMKAAWEAQLRSVPLETIKRALAHLQNDPPAWPPSLAEWISLCKQFRRVEHMPALPPPPVEVSEEGKQKINEAINSMIRETSNHLAWAKYPGSKQAVALLIRGAREDRRLRDILDHHLQTDGRDCRREDAVAAIRKLQASMRSQMAAQED
jgi:hypothetical protein